MNAYGALKEDNMMISAIVGNESTNYNYACVSIEKLSDLCVCFTMIVEETRRGETSDPPPPNGLQNLKLSRSQNNSKYSHSLEIKQDN